MSWLIANEFYVPTSFYMANEFYILINREWVLCANEFLYG